MRKQGGLQNISKMQASEIRKLEFLHDDWLSGYVRGQLAAMDNAVVETQIKLEEVTHTLFLLFPLTHTLSLLLSLPLFFAPLSLTHTNLPTNTHSFSLSLALSRSLSHTLSLSFSLSLSLSLQATQIKVEEVPFIRVCMRDATHPYMYA